MSRDRQVNLRVDADAHGLRREAQPVHGTALVQAPRYGAYAYGDRIRFSGTPLTPPEFDDFSTRTIWPGAGSPPWSPTRR